MRYNIHKNRVNWRDIKLWKLSQTDREGAKVELCRIFVRDGRIIKYDIQTMLSLLQNCRYFVIGDDNNRLDAVRHVRNIDFAHTDLFELSKRGLKKALSNLLQFFQHPSFIGFQCISTTVIEIQGLLTNNKHSLAKIEVFSAFNSLQLISQANINAFLSINEDKNGPDRQHKFVLIFSLFVGFLIAMSELLRKNNTNGEEDLYVAYIIIFFMSNMLLYTYFLVMRAIAILSPKTRTISRGKVERNSCCRWETIHISYRPNSR